MTHRLRRWCERGNLELTGLVPDRFGKDDVNSSGRLGALAYITHDGPGISHCSLNSNHYVGH